MYLLSGNGGSSMVFAIIRAGVAGIALAGIFLLLTIAVKRFIAAKKGGNGKTARKKENKASRNDVIVVGSYNPRTMTKEQKRIYSKYFCNGCLPFGKMKDSHYMDEIGKELARRMIRRRALDKFGLDETQVSEISAVEFRDFCYVDGVLLKNGNSSKISDCWLFFGEEQLFVYKYTFDMCNSSETERAGEYFYKDITSFSSTDSVKEFFFYTSQGCLPFKKQHKGCSKTSTFTVVVTDETYFCSMRSSEAVQNAIFAMKQKIREKKG